MMKTLKLNRLILHTLLKKKEEIETFYPSILTTTCYYFQDTHECRDCYGSCENSCAGSCSSACSNNCSGSCEDTASCTVLSTCGLI